MDRAELEKIYKKHIHEYLEKDRMARFEDIPTRIFIDAMEEALAISRVSCSLPSKEAVTLEAYKQAEEMKKQNDKVDKFAYSCGYIDGYEKCKSLLKTK